MHQSVNLSVWMTPPMTLEVASRLIANGTAEKLTEQQCRAAARRQRLVQQSLGHSAASVSEGYHVWLPLPEGWRPDVFRSECARLGVLVSKGRSFAMNAGDAGEAVRLCVSHEPSEERLRRGIEAVANMLNRKPAGESLMI